LGNAMWMRFRNSTAAVLGTNQPMQIDFSMVSLQWIE
jgi:hypothetical protein